MGPVTGDLRPHAYSPGTAGTRVAISLGMIGFGEKLVDDGVDAVRSFGHGRVLSTNNHDHGPTILGYGVSPLPRPDIAYVPIRTQRWSPVTGKIPG
jgi:hypothetical protein